MALSRLASVASTFNTCAETLHEKFVAISDEPACSGCRSAGFGEAILVAWLQTAWGNFTHRLIVASALGTQRRIGTSIRPIAGVKSQSDANKKVKTAAACTAKKYRYPYPVWHDPLFVVEVGTLLELKNLPRIENALGATLVPRQLTAFRNYLVHPGDGTRSRYEKLQAKLGMLSMDPEDLLHQFRSPGLMVFTSWVRELQRIANDSTR